MKYGMHITVLTVLALVASVDGTCPKPGKQAEEMTKRCMSPLAKALDLSSDHISSEALETFCHSSVAHVMSCLDKLFGDCARENPGVRRLIDKVVDLDAVRKSLNYFCSNIDVLIDHDRCIDRQRSSLLACTNVEKRKLMNKAQWLKLKAYDYGTARLRDEIIKAGCTFNDGVSHCFDPMRSTCGDKVADIYVSLVVAGRPPGCTTKIPQNHPGQDIDVNTPRYQKIKTQDNQKSKRLPPWYQTIEKLDNQNFKLPPTETKPAENENGLFSSKRTIGIFAGGTFIVLFCVIVAVWYRCPAKTKNRIGVTRRSEDRAKMLV